MKSLSPPSTLILIGVCLSSLCFGAGGKTMIVRNGAAVSEASSVAQDWPDGVLKLVNDPLRHDGWNSWFSGFPNDVERYRFRLAKTADVDHLANRFSTIKADRLRILLAAGVGPIVDFGGVRAPGIMFAIGNQKTIDEWYSRLPKVESGVRTFGGHQLEKPPRAMPPTLTIYVDNDFVALEQLQIPLHVEVDVRPGLDKGRWKWDKEKKTWIPPPKDIVRFIHDHRAKQGNEKQQGDAHPAAN